MRDRSRNHFQLTIYACYLCGKLWRARFTGTLCTVRHEPGTCCHYQEKEVSGETLRQIGRLIESS